jgi:hypothetical protein
LSNSCCWGSQAFRTCRGIICLCSTLQPY